MNPAEPSTRELDEAAFRSTFAEPMRDVTPSAKPVVDIWPYVRAVPPSELRGHEVWDDFVESVYRTGDERFDHVLVCTKTPDVFLAVVVNRTERNIYGHHLLNLRQFYGLSASNEVA
jgi:hypothetical protein